MLLPPDVQPTFQNLVRRLANLPAMIQNALIEETDDTLGTELEEFIHTICVNWASDEYWASRTSTGARPGSFPRRPTVHPRLDAAPPSVQVQTTQNPSPVDVCDLSPAAPSATDLSPPGHHSITSDNAHDAHLHASANPGFVTGFHGN